MHEMSLVGGMVDALLKAVDHHNATRVFGVSVVIGDNSHLSDEAMRFNFEVLTRGTAAEGAEVTIRREPGTMACRDCGISTTAGQHRVCPTCGSVRVEVTGGDQCYLESFDVEDDGPG